MCPGSVPLSIVNLSLKLTREVIYLHCRRQPYFFYRTLSKTGYCLRICHGRFHLQGLPRAVRIRNASRARITKTKLLAHCGIRTRAFKFRSKGATTELRRLMSVKWIKNLPGFDCAIFRNLPVAWCPRPSEVQFVVYFCHIIFVSFSYLTN